MRQAGRRFPQGGFTLLELLTVIVIVIILAVMLMPAVDKLKEVAQGVHCRNNLRNLHVAFSSYITEKGWWPQVPESVNQLADPGLKQYGKWWIAEMEPFGGGERTWKCPTYVRLLAATVRKDQDVSPIHYIPTEFDDKRDTPYKWSGQPWVLEVGNFHGQGNLILYPDGSVRPFDQLTEPEGAKDTQAQNPKKKRTGSGAASPTPSPTLLAANSPPPSTPAPTSSPDPRRATAVPSPASPSPAAPARRSPDVAASAPYAAEPEGTPSTTAVEMQKSEEKVVSKPFPLVWAILAAVLLLLLGVAILRRRNGRPADRG